MHPIDTIRARVARPALRVRLARLGHIILALGALRRQRQRLAEMDAARRDDIGISEDQARAEAARPIWDVPPTWRL